MGEIDRPKPNLPRGEHRRVSWGRVALVVFFAVVLAVGEHHDSVLIIVGYAIGAFLTLLAMGGLLAIAVRWLFPKR